MAPDLLEETVSVELSRMQREVAAPPPLLVVCLRHFGPLGGPLGPLGHEETWLTWDGSRVDWARSEYEDSPGAHHLTAVRGRLEPGGALALAWAEPEAAWAVAEWLDERRYLRSTGRSASSEPDPGVR